MFTFTTMRSNIRIRSDRTRLQGSTKTKLLTYTSFLDRFPFYGEIRQVLSESQSDISWCPRHVAFGQPEITLKILNYWKNRCHFQSCWICFIMRKFFVEILWFLANYEKACRNISCNLVINISLINGYIP